MDGGEDAVGEIVEGAVSIDMGLTKAALAMADLATPGAEVAAGCAIVQSLL